MLSHNKLTYVKKNAGFTLLEVMVAIVIFSVGLLGLAGLQATALEFNHNALSRTLAILQAENMADRIRTNLQTFDGTEVNYYNTVNAAVPSVPTAAYTSCYYMPTDTSPPASCTAQNIADIDIYEWNKRNSDVLPSGIGSVSRTGNVFTITVMWDEQRTGATGTACGTDPTVDLECYTIQIEQ